MITLNCPSFQFLVLGFPIPVCCIMSVASLCTTSQSTFCLIVLPVKLSKALDSASPIPASNTPLFNQPDRAADGLTSIKPILPNKLIGFR